LLGCVTVVRLSKIDWIEKEKVEILFQLNGAPTHFSHEVRNGLNLRLPNPHSSPLFSSVGI
jgi:hypothetical protein